MTDSLGIEQTSDVVVSLAAFAQAAARAGADKQLSLSDLGLFLGPLATLPAAILGAGDVPAELEDLDTDEAAALVEDFLAHWPVTTDRARELVAAALRIASGLAGLIREMHDTPRLEPA